MSTKIVDEKRIEAKRIEFEHVAACTDCGAIMRILPVDTVFSYKTENYLNGRKLPTIGEIIKSSGDPNQFTLRCPNRCPGRDIYSMAHVELFLNEDYVRGYNNDNNPDMEKEDKESEPADKEIPEEDSKP